MVQLLIILYFFFCLICLHFVYSNSHVCMYKQKCVEIFIFLSKHISTSSLSPSLNRYAYSALLWLFPLSFFLSTQHTRAVSLRHWLRTRLPSDLLFVRAMISTLNQKTTSPSEPFIHSSSRVCQLAPIIN